VDAGLKAILEALLFAADEPLPLRRIAGLLEDRSSGELRAALEELRADYAGAGSALQVVEVAGGYRLVTRPEMAPWVARLFATPGRARLSQPALETLAIIAYRQPVARVELEEIRGVNVEAVLRTLIERDLVSIVGRDEGVGRPLLYGTTDGFLTYFGLNSTTDLPRMDEIEVFLAGRENALGEEGAEEPAAAPDSGGEESAADAAIPRAEAGGPAGDATEGGADDEDRAGGG
jgi:segregation and condensation protein B